MLEGLAESENENLEQKYIYCLQEHFNIKTASSDIDKIHRFGRSVGGKPRPIIIRYITHSARDSVLYAARELRNKPPNLFINEHLPPEVKAQRAELRTVSIQARKAGANNVKLTGDKLTINGKTYTYENIDMVPAEYSLQEARTVRVNTETTAFYSKHSYLSNFYPAPFIDNVQYNSVEQLYQRRKLEAAGRTDLLPKLMQECDCFKMKHLGDAIRVPHVSDWLQNRDQIMQNVVYEKFKQNEHLMMKLKTTQGTLVEATWGDTYWGAGVGLSSDKLRTNTWTGQNKLGRILMTIRDN